MADGVFAGIKEIEKTKREIVAAAGDYRPRLSVVRTIQRDIRKIEEEIAELNVKISRIGGIVSEEQGGQARDRVASLTVQRDFLLTKIPADWNDVYRRFSILLKAGNNARRNYRRNVDAAYESLVDVIATITDVEKLEALENDLRELATLVESEPVSVVRQRIKSVNSGLTEVRHTTLLQDALVDARRALRAETPKIEIARERLTLATAQLDSEIGWRRLALRELLSRLEQYEAAIADTIGIRNQAKLPDHVALGIMECRSTPRDIFVNF